MKNVKAIQEENWSLSQEKRLRSFVGLANYYHHFIQDFSKVARTLFNLLKKWLSQEWDEPCHQAFGELESEFSSPPVLKFAELDKPFEVHTGASDFSIGGWLMQGEWPLHMRALSLMVVRPCATCARNGYPKSGMSLATKSLRSLRARSLRRPWPSSWSLTNLLRCIWGRVTLPLADVDPRWMPIAYGSIKLNGC